MAEYFNFRSELAQGRWDRAGFLRKWWRMYADDSRWAPPAWSQLRQALVSKRIPHLERSQPRFIMVEALPRRGRSHAGGGALTTINQGLVMEEPVAAAVVLIDPRRSDSAAYLSLLHVANNGESLERLLKAVREQVGHRDVRRLILPVGLSPYLGTGVLQSHFHRVPPLHAPYAPPYAPELFASVCRPLGRGLLLAAEPGTGRDGERSGPGPAQVQPMDPNRLASDLLPLFAQTAPGWAVFPRPDELEARFLLWWILRRPALAWVAELDGEPVGYLLAQPDGSEPLCRSKGGRSLLARVQLQILEMRQPRSLRILSMGVDPAYRRRGIGRQLWQQMLAAGRRGDLETGWRSVTAGPLPSTERAGLGFLTALGLSSRETYLLHRYEFD